jgi:predicted ribosome quality control (RQC) complex YloA/Tae2 family protein
VHEHTFARTGEYDNPDHRHRESLYDDVGEGLSPERPAVDDEQVFRESLFDALADDEGAAYWEGVYGQPVHVYPNTKTGPDGKLERMSDEEYAEYVRSKMWEKSHQHILEEREARERSRKQGKERRQRLEEEAARQDAERDHVRQRMQDSLRRGEERKKAKEAEAAWTAYVKKWEALKEHQSLAQEEGMRVRELIPWPVVSGRWKHVSKEEIEYFFEQSSAWKDDATALLKVERVRWHPDKMQHRFGQHIDHETMKLVTAVFQVVDRLWTDHRR